jgi:hypothetical protein
MPEFGHYDTWLIDLLQKLIQQNTGKLLYPDRMSVADYENTAENFVMIPIHDQELQERLDARISTLKGKNGNTPLPKLTSDLQYLSDALGLELPFLPVTSREEFELFSSLMFHKMNKFDSCKMALLWADQVDGINIFPKLPAQLREYYKAWERNKRVRKAAEKMKNDRTLLEEYLERTVPQELEDTRKQIEKEDNKEAPAETEESDDDVDMVVDVVVQEGVGAQEVAPTQQQLEPPSCLPVATMPQANSGVMPREMLLDQEEARPTVANVPIAVEPQPQQQAPAGKRRIGHRMKDKRKRAKRKCRKCLMDSCRGNNNKDNCVNYCRRCGMVLLCPGRDDMESCIYNGCNAY